MKLEVSAVRLVRRAPGRFVGHSGYFRVLFLTRGSAQFALKGPM